MIGNIIQSWFFRRTRIKTEISPWNIDENTNSEDQYLSIIFRPNLKDSNSTKRMGEVVRFHYASSFIGLRYPDDDLLNMRMKDLNHFRSDIGLDVSYNKNSSPFLRVCEFEWEKFPERTGSGDTGFKLEIFFTDHSYRYLRESIKSQNFPKQQAGKSSYQPMLLIQIPCEEFIIPNGRKIEPGSINEDRFEWQIKFSETRCLLFGFNSSDEYTTPLNLISDETLVFDTLKAWQLKFNS